MQKYKLVISASILIFFNTISFAQSDSVKTSPYRLGLFDLNGGADVRLNSLENSRLSAYSGGYFRMQASFFNLYFSKPGRKIEFGDLINAELSGGYSASNSPYLKSGLRLPYNFSFGAVGMWHANKNIDIALSIALLRFGRDYLSDFWGGSDFTLKFRVKRWVAECSWISENHLYFGHFNKNDLVKNENLPKGMISVAYLFKPHKLLGIRLETLPLYGSFETENGSREKMMSIKLYYGINF